MKNLLNKVNSQEILDKATELLQVAFSTNNMGIRYNLFHEANDLKKIAAIIYKYELMQQKGDFYQ